METFSFIKSKNLSNLPRTTGIYCFKRNGRFLYIGKAINIKDRVKNHFQSPSYRDNLYLNSVKSIGYIETNSEIEALLLEAKLIKKHQPKFNIVWKDDKNYFYVAITKEDFPKISITHQPDRSKAKHIGPFIEGGALKKTLKILRKAFPYYTAKHPAKPCLWCGLNLCPGPSPDKKEYKKNIKKLVSVLKGESNKVFNELKGEMKKASALQEYERAGKLRDKTNVLERIMVHGKIFQPTEIDVNQKLSWPDIQKVFQGFLNLKRDISRIEAFDVSNIQGKEATASMVTFIDGNPYKDFYRKFRIRLTDKPNDVAMIKETLVRRFNHPEWGLPDLILIDGGKAQLNTALRIQNPRIKGIGIVSLAKRNNELFVEGEKDPLLLKSLPKDFSNLILRIRDEAHRFAIKYHKELRKRNLIPQ